MCVNSRENFWTSATAVPENTSPVIAASKTKICIRFMGRSFSYFFQPIGSTIVKIIQ